MARKKFNGKKKDIYKIVQDKIVGALDKGEVPWRKPWAVQGQWPANFVSKRKYNGMNAMLLAMAGYDCPYWVTFKQIQKKDGHVLKGEKATEVVFWKIIRKQVEDKDTGEMKEKKFFFLKYHNVYNLRQTSISESYVAPELPGNVREPNEVFKDYTEREEIGVRYGGDRAYYSPIEDIIGMPTPEAFQEEAEFHSTSFHEAIHSTGHKNRLKRFDNPLEEKEVASGENYSKEELVAEIGAATLCHLTGIDTEKAFNNSVAYIQTWKKRIKEDSRLVMRAASQAQKAVDFIIPEEDVEEDDE